MQATIAGIPIPVTTPLFVGAVAVHVAAGITAVASGAVAIFATKRRGRHSRAGAVYYWALGVVAATMAVLAAIRWREDRVLFALGLAAFAAATLGRAALRRRWSSWVRTHIACMGSSYVLLVVAFYVDNGPNLPVWRALPHPSYWAIPAAVGAPLIVRALLMHPLVRRAPAR